MKSNLGLRWTSLLRVSLGVAAMVVIVSPAAAQSLAGLWDATVVVNGVEMPFRMEFSGEGANVTGSFFNGAEKITSTSGRFENGSLVLGFDFYASRLEAKWRDGRLEGKYDRGTRGLYPFRASRAAPSSQANGDGPAAAGVPSIDGQWLIPLKSPKGESAWRFIVQQAGAEVSAAILRVDGDTGTLTGRYAGGKFVLSHFSGVRPLLLEVTPQTDGTLELLENGKNRLLALRPAEARAKGLAGPADPSRHTTVKDPNEPFRFSFPDLEGRIVSHTDARFRGKVVIVSITGSWCPNCHDEAPFLAALHRKYRNQGLEIVALSFEEADQLKNPTRLHAFIRKFGIGYLVLLAGEPAELNAKVPQAVNLNAFPTTFFLGRDGRVRTVHAGFPSAASLEAHAEAEREITALVEKLLSERVSAASVSAPVL